MGADRRSLPVELTGPARPAAAPAGDGDRARGLAFRHALALSVAGALAVLVTMAALTALALAEADRLLDRLAASQDQLARVTRIEADVNALLLDSPGGAPSLAPFPDARTLADVQALALAYTGTIAAEQALIGGGPEAAASQAEEARMGQALAAMIAELPALSGTAEMDAWRRRFRELAGAIEAGERAEAAAAIATMRRLERRTTRASIAVFSLAALLGLAGGWAMLRSMGRPLRRLEDAAARVGGAGDGPPAPVDPEGFAEIRQVGRAFNRLGEEVAAQRRALAEHNRDLEAQVAERTREIEESRARLAEIDSARRLFFAQVSHELRTPATVIRGEAEVALRDPDAPPDDLRESLEHIATYGALLHRRLDDLLALARAEDGTITLQREPVRLGPLLSAVIALAEPYVRSTGMVLTGQGLDRRDLVVCGDSSWLQQALLAVIDNAAKFAVGGEVRIALDADAGTARITVTDNGPGVDPATLPFLFERYYQAPNGARAGGAGVGLSVTRWVIEQHGGAATARNLEGQGLLIELRLPRTS